MAVEVSQGVCDLCGAPSDASLQECNWLTCTFQHCEGGLYHQECLEKYLKSNKLEKNRKTGFKCPRGNGKGTRFDQACPGRIDKSHPIHPRNEDKKKTKLAAVVVEPQRPAKPAVPVVANGKPAKGKEEPKADTVKATAPVKAGTAAKAAAPAAAALAQYAAVQKAGKKEASALPPRPEADNRTKLAEIAAQMRREMGLSGASTSSLSSHGSKGDLKGMVNLSAGPSKPAAVSTVSAWGKPAAPGPEPPAPSPQPSIMSLSQHPSLHQLFTQASKKASSKPAPAAAAASTSAGQGLKPAPSVPAPVLNPPTPVWPALSATQSSAAALFSASSTPSASGAHTPRETAPRPASPPSAWGSTTATPAAQQAAGASSSSATPSSAVSRTQSGTGHGLSGGATPSGSGPAGPALAAVSAAAGSVAPAVTAAVRGASTPGVAAGASGSGAGTGSGAAGASGSGHVSGGASDAQQAAAVVSGASAAAPAAGLPASRSGSQLVGADFTDEEAKEPKLTKAQKKNLKRTEKKKVPSATGLDQQNQGEAAGQEAAEPQPSGDGAGAAAGAGSTAGTAATSQRAGAGAGAGAASSGKQRATEVAAGGGGAAPVSVSGAAGSGVHRRHASRGSDAPEQAHVGEAEEAAVMEELCINCIVSRKVMSLITQLQRLGALEFVAAAAVQRYGSNLLGALEWLLVAGADAASRPPEVVLAAAAESAANGETEVDISDELQQLAELQTAMGLPLELLQQCVLDCNGDVQTAANTAMERMLATPSAGGGGGAGAGARVSSSGNLQQQAAAPGGSRGGSVYLRPSASFYSVSSCDGAAAGSESDAVQHMQHHPPHQQQPATSSHFGVRLQDEPAGSSGYEDGQVGAYTAGLLRGGVVLGAAGWQNGYLRDPAAAAGLPGATAASTAPSGGRNTSRLMHWLGDDSARAAALGEEHATAGRAGAAGRPAGQDTRLGSGDPVLESPFAGRSDAPRGLDVKTASDSPSLHTWLGSNGYHPQGIGAAGHSSSAATAAAAAAAAAAASHSHELYGPMSNGNFSFMSTLTKPQSSSVQGTHGAALEQQGQGYASYGSRWGGLAGAGLQQQQHFGGGAGAAAGSSEAESMPHNDGDDLSSIMALINVR